ncbi:hypothetical protein [Amycolatopsis anabasis]|uniref:hypothetical protein n=1 Tax=Amycolatopsis anabasis TaxID=1840409 RepID=UPI00131D317F|nr:hypothetical protein [Amycolatopsis anabasis]
MSRCFYCGAEYGEVCRPFCTVDDVGVVGTADLVPVEGGRYAVKHCGRCQGGGRDQADLILATPCRCLVDRITYLDLRAEEHLEKANRALAAGGAPRRAARHTVLARRWKLLALAAALRGLRVDAYADAHKNLVLAKTSHGTVQICLPIDLHSATLITRTDGTLWHLKNPAGMDEARIVAWHLRWQVPELASPRGQLCWTVAVTAKPGQPWRRPEVLGVFPRGPLATSTCQHTGAAPMKPCCPGWKASRLARHLDTLASAVVIGAFPVPSDTPQAPATFEHAARQAILNTANLVASGDLAICNLCG